MTRIYYQKNQQDRYNHNTERSVVVGKNDRSIFKRKHSQAQTLIRLMTKIDEVFRELSNVKTFISETIIKVFREKEAAEKKRNCSNSLNLKRR